MLHAISWKEYFTLVVIGLLVYYGWWLVRFLSVAKTSGGAGKAASGAASGIRSAGRVGWG